MQRKTISFIVLLTISLLLFPQAVFAGVKVTTDDKPVYVTSHMLGSELIQHPNGSTSLENIITGFVADKYPLQAQFKTLTSFVSTARYESPVTTIMITNDSGKEILAKYDFNMLLARPGSIYNQIVNWKVSFPAEGFYAFNIFVDGTLVGYYPFYIWTKGIVIK